MIQGIDGVVDAAASPAPLEGQEALDRLRRFGGERLARDMVALFAQSVPDRLAAARAALAAGDAEALVRTMHGLKSSCAQLGGPAAAQWCAEVEHAARAGQLDGLAPSVDRAAQAVGELVAWLERALPPDQEPR